MAITPSDTTPAARRIMIDGYRRMSPTEKLAVVASLNRSTNRLAAARIRRQFGPNLSENELRLRLAALRLDARTMTDVFGWDPRVRGL